MDLTQEFAKTLEELQKMEKNNLHEYLSFSSADSHDCTYLIKELPLIAESKFPKDVPLKTRLFILENLLSEDKNVKNVKEQNDTNEIKEKKTKQDALKTESNHVSPSFISNYWNQTEAKVDNHACVKKCEQVESKKDNEKWNNFKPFNVPDTIMAKQEILRKEIISQENVVKCDDVKNGSKSQSECSLPVEVAYQVALQCSGFEDIAGLEGVKQSLREAILYPTKYPQLFSKGRSAWSRALLFGPPGVGKTALVHAVAAEAQLPLYQVSSADLINAWVGNTEKLIRRVFSTLGERHCILLLDEVDSLCRQRSANDTEHSRHATTELLIQMQRYEGSAMFLLCATNCPWEIDPAFLRRLQQRIYVPMPDQEARESIIVSCIGNLGDLHVGAEWERFLRATEGLTGSDLKGLARSALMIPLREMTNATHWIETCGGKMIPTDVSNIMALHCTLDEIPNWKVWCRQLQINDLWKALEEADYTVTSNSLVQFQNFISGRAVLPKVGYNYSSKKMKTN